MIPFNLSKKGNHQKMSFNHQQCKAYHAILETKPTDNVKYQMSYEKETIEKQVALLMVCQDYDDIIGHCSVRAFEPLFENREQAYNSFKKSWPADGTCGWLWSLLTFEQRCVVIAHIIQLDGFALTAGYEDNYSEKDLKEIEEPTEGPIPDILVNEKEMKDELKVMKNELKNELKKELKKDLKHGFKLMAIDLEDSESD